MQIVCRLEDSFKNSALTLGFCFHHHRLNVLVVALGRRFKAKLSPRDRDCRARFGLDLGISLGDHPMASLTDLPTRLSISTKVSIVNLAVFLFTTSDTRGRETMSISAASACFR